MVTALGALVFTGLSLQQTRVQNQVAESGQVTDRFNSAIENLKSDSLDIRLGGIYSLQRLMHDSPRDQAAIVKILAAYIRGHDRPLDAKPSKNVLEIAEGRAGVSLHLVPDDVEAAARVIADRDPAHDGSAHRGNVVQVIDLSGAHLEGVDLSDANLEFVNFAGAYLDYAKLRKVNLTATNFDRASLKEVDFTGADVESTSFREAQLAGAQFRHADAGDADFSGAGSARAVLAAENLRDAYLVRTELCRGRIPLKPGKGYVCDEHLT
ncbi:pentapeptide repeat-containing protein [Streptomyces sp. P10-4]|uniref:pentapeptide repeat-containing protein n=1 Tax=Streptomyces sp. P10-4 TaxID=3421645 RepID=UPI003D2C2758